MAKKKKRREKKKSKRKRKKTTPRNAYAVKIEHQIEFANAAKVLVQSFNVELNKLEGIQFIIFIVRAHHKVQRCVPAISSSEEKIRQKTCSRLRVRVIKFTSSRRCDIKK